MSDCPQADHFRSPARGLCPLSPVPVQDCCLPAAVLRLHARVLGETHMKALVWHGKEDIRYERVPDPRIEQPTDAIIKVTSCAICGSDLHLFNNFMPGMKKGDVLGHETMGVVIEVGKSVKKLGVGERVVIPFTIICGE